MNAKGATTIIQLSNPVCGAKKYPKAIEALKQNGFLFFINRL
ncbi:hypothetical protein bcere0026_57790 [Bacillus mycoides]|uniref:Uncharacterized protein n=1 Tax=Bacillus mycoides TaxID=1405 RepID=C2Y464_BACMY|nr:hypothetical protein bcere0026_57790 [Bacillus mycoides]